MTKTWGLGIGHCPSQRGGNPAPDNLYSGRMGVAGPTPAAMSECDRAPARAADVINSRTWPAALACTRAELLSLVAITAIAIGLRAIYSNDPFRYDESVNWLSVARFGMLRALGDYQAPNNHILHTVLVCASASLFGNGERVLRLPAFAFGCAIVPTTFIAIRELHGRRAALIAAALVAVSTTLIEYSVNARGYSMFVLFTLILVIVSVRIAARPTRGRWTAFALSAASGTLTIPVMLYPLLCCSAWLMLNARRQARPLLFVRDLALTLASFVALTAAGYSWALVNSGAGNVLANRFVESKDFDYFFGKLDAMTNATCEAWHWGWPPGTAGVMLALAICGVWRGARPRGGRIPGEKHERAMLLPLSVVVSFAAVLLQRVLPYERVWMWMLPLYLGLVANGFVWLVGLLAPRRRSKLIVCAAAPLLTVALGARLIRDDSVRSFNAGEKLPQARAVAAWLAEHVRPIDALVTRGIIDPPVRYYLDRAGVAWPSTSPADAKRILAITRTPDVSLDVVRDATFPRVNDLRPPRVAFQEGEVIVYALYPRSPRQQKER